MYNDPTDIPLTIIEPRKIICPVCNGYGWYRKTKLEYEKKTGRTFHFSKDSYTKDYEYDFIEQIRYPGWPVKCRACKGKKEFYVYPTLTETEFLKLIKF